DSGTTRHGNDQRSRVRKQTAGDSRKPSELSPGAIVFTGVVTLMAWLVLFVLCWPLALMALTLYPIGWIALMPGVSRPGIWRMSGKRRFLLFRSILFAV